MVRYDPNKIQELRTSRGLTHAEFAAAIGSTRQMVYLWEGGQKPGAATIEKICSAFSVQPNFFFTGTFILNHGNNKR